MRAVHWWWTSRNSAYQHSLRQRVRERRRADKDFDFPRSSSGPRPCQFRYHPQHLLRSLAEALSHFERRSSDDEALPALATARLFCLFYDC
jgi:hypothetical protein